MIHPDNMPPVDVDNPVVPSRVETKSQKLAGVIAAEALLETILSPCAQGTNGSAVYSNNKALMGYVKAGYFLQIPRDLFDECSNMSSIEVDLRNFGTENGPSTYMGKGVNATAHRDAYPYFHYRLGDVTAGRTRWDVARIGTINFYALVEAGMPALDAYFAATLRARWMVTGALNALLNDDATTITEHVIVENDDTRFGNIMSSTCFEDLSEQSRDMMVAFLSAGRASGETTEWVVKHAEAIWAAVEFVFRTRGHHFKSSGDEAEIYKSAYTRFLKASFEGEFVWPSGVDMSTIFHAAIHPFKIKALAVCTAHYLAHGMLSQAAKVRLTASPCGHAVITTCVAALNTMRGEIWWDAFERTYADSLRKVDMYADQINNNRYGYHQACELYGVERANHVTEEVGAAPVTIEKAKSEIKFIAASCQGLIQALHKAKESGYIKGFSLANSRALNKAANDVPLLTAKITAMIEATIAITSSAETIQQLMEVALPVTRAATKDAKLE